MEKNTNPTDTYTLHEEPCKKEGGGGTKIAMIHLNKSKRVEICNDQLNAEKKKQWK